MKKINIGIVGAGNIGSKRAEVLKKFKNCHLVAVSEVDPKRASEFAKTYQCEIVSKWRDLINRPDLHVVIVSVPNAFTAPVVIAALKSGKHVLSEKPFGKNSKESLAIIKAARKNKRLVKVGFNHRFHAAVGKAKEIFDRGEIGKIMFIRSRYGYGGRLGMQNEWRFNKKISGGGELLDQGVHIIDLCRYFAGEFKEVFGSVSSKFWSPGVDDNAFAIMKNEKVTASFHVSATQWKNLFSFEIYGDKGFLDIEGKGGSYGRETLIFGKRKKEFGIPILKNFEFSEDISWEKEWQNFLGALENKNKINGDMNDGYFANYIAEAIYKSSKLNKIVRIS